jgi:cell division protein FtsA
LIAAGIIITGGSAKMEGAVELAEEVFHMPVRLGSPQYVNGLMDVIRNPIHATGVGLLLYGFENIVRRNQRSTPVSGSVADVWGQMKSWFQGQF